MQLGAEVMRIRIPGMKIFTLKGEIYLKIKMNMKKQHLPIEKPSI
jgi:hypothetical protein